MESVRETVCLTNRAAGMGYKAAMVRTPHYYKTFMSRPEAQMLYYRAVADESRIPLIIYNWPATTGVDIAPEAVAQLSEHPNIIAIKESSGDLAKVMQMIREVRPGLSGAGRVGAHFVAIARDGRVRRDSGVRERGALLDDRDLGGLPHQRRSRARLAESHRQSRDTGDGEARRAWLEVCNGPQRLLRGSARSPLVPPSAEAKKEIELAFKNLNG